MKKSKLKSKSIYQLEEKIKKYGNSAIEEFLSNLKKSGAPIIEDIENDCENNLVTFIYKGNKECASVLFVPDIGLDKFKDNYIDFKMERITETDLWYITYEVKNNLRFVYYFSPNDPLDDNWNDRFCSRVKYDIYCKNLLIFSEESPEEKGSYVIMPKAQDNIWSKEIIPWVRQNYNITEKPEEAIICGLSLGGLTAAYLGLKYPDVFGNVLSQSGYFCYDPEDYSGIDGDCWIGTKFKEKNKLSLKFYLDMGVLETKYKIIDPNINLKDALMDKGYNVDLQWFNGGHDYLSWGETLANGLISLIGMKLGD